MKDHSISHSRRYSLAVAAAIGLVIAWRVLAALYPHSATSDPDAVRWVMSGLGLWFLACGVWAYCRRVSTSTGLFLWFCVFSGIHWGGPVGMGPDGFQAILLAVYIVGAVAAQALFLDLAVTAANRNIGRPARWRWLVYAPVAAGVVLIAVLAVRPAEQQVLEIIPGLLVLAELLGVAGGGIWIYRFITAWDGQRRLRTAVVAAALVLGWGPYVLTMAGAIDWPGPDGLSNLPQALIPASLAWYLTRRAPEA